MRRVMLISEHASPLAQLGGEDAGGQNVVVSQLAQHLASMDYDVDIFTRRDSSDLSTIHPITDRVRVIHVPAGPPHPVKKEHLLPYMSEFSDFMKDFVRSQARPYDIVHAHFWMSGLVALELKRTFGLPFAITFHALGRIRRLYQGKADHFPPVRIEIEEELVNEASQILAECPQDRSDLIRFYSADPKKISIIPRGFNPSEIWPVNRELARVVLGLPASDYILLQLGRMVPRKGVDTVVEGFARLIHTHHIDGKLVIVGGETKSGEFWASPEIKRLKTIARERKVEDKVLFRGPCRREELKYYYNAADVFVTMPWYEPFGTTSLEAMACGIPVIGSNVGGIKFSVQDQWTGFLIHPHDVEALADDLSFLFLRPPLRQLMGQLGQKRARDLFSWEHVAKAVSIIYEKMCPIELREPVGVEDAGVMSLFDQWRERRENDAQAVAWAGAERRMRWF